MFCTAFSHAKPPRNTHAAREVALSRDLNYKVASLIFCHFWRTIVRGEIASNKNSHASQPTAKNSEPSSNLSNETSKDIFQKETAVNFLKGNEFKAILPALKKV